MMKTKVALAVLAAGLSSQMYAVELGEFNGTKFSVGGYLKAETVFNQPDAGENSVEGSVRQSRFNLGTSSIVDGHKVRGFIEGDFWDNNTTSGDSSYAWRLRHAYINIDNLTVGQTWNGQFFANAPFDTEMLNFWGLGIGTIAGNGAPIRPDLVVHYVKDGLRLTMQDPLYSNADTPDVVAQYSYRTNGHAFNVAVTGREVDTTPTVDSDDESKYGAAISLATKLKFGDTSLSLSGFTGEGAAIYAGWGYNGSRGLDAQMEVNANGDLITTTGFSAGIGHKFSDSLRGNLRYGQVKVDESALSEDTLKQTAINMIYTYMPNVELGIEFRDQNAGNRPPSSAGTSIRPAGQQVELMAMYKF